MNDAEHVHEWEVREEVCSGCGAGLPILDGWRAQPPASVGDLAALHREATNAARDSEQGDAVVSLDDVLLLIDRAAGVSPAPSPALRPALVSALASLKGIATDRTVATIHDARAVAKAAAARAEAALSPAPSPEPPGLRKAAIKARKAIAAVNADTAAWDQLAAADEALRAALASPSPVTPKENA